MKARCPEGRESIVVSITSPPNVKGTGVVDEKSGPDKLFLAA